MTTPSSGDHICISSIDWGYLWQGPQEVMTRLARAGADVLFVENTGIRRPAIRDRDRLLARLRAASGRRGPSPVPDPRIRIVSPLVLPFPWSPLARIVNQRLFVGPLRERATAMGMVAPTIWTFLPTPLAIDVIRAFRTEESASAYYCVADFEPVTDDPDALRAAEVELLALVDVVFAGGRVLQRDLSARHPRVVLAPFSVADHFFGPPQAVPADLARIPRPRIGYVGGLHRHVDAALLAAVVSRMRDVAFVFLGPHVPGPAGDPLRDLEALPNAHFIGRREHGELPAYVDGFDACLVPYERSRFTDTVWPTKLHEYLARGKPVVSTPLPEVGLLGYGPETVAVAADPEGMEDAIRSAIASVGHGDRRRELALAYSWERTVQRMLAELWAVAQERSGAPS